MVTTYTKYILIPFLFLFARGGVAAAENVPSPQQSREILKNLQSYLRHQQEQRTLTAEEKIEKGKNIRRTFIRDQNKNEYALDGMQKGYQTIFEELPFPLLCLSLIVCVSVFAETLYRFSHIKENTILVYISFLFCPLVAILQGVVCNFGKIHQAFLVPVAISIVVLLCWSLALIIQEWPQTSTLSPSDMLLFTLCLFVAAYYFVVEDCKRESRLPFTPHPTDANKTTMESWRDTDQSFGVKINYFFIEGWAQGSTIASLQEQNYTLVATYDRLVEAEEGKTYGKKASYDALLKDKKTDADGFFRGINGDLAESTQKLSRFRDADSLRAKITTFQDKLTAMENTFKQKYDAAVTAMKALDADGSRAQAAFSQVIDLQVAHKITFTKEAKRTMEKVKKKVAVTS